jgi:hypothetical protein
MGSRGPAFVIALGFAAGAASGLLGVGGGIVMVPGLVLGIGLTQHRAHATSLAAIVPIGLVGYLVFAVSGHVNYALSGLFVLGAIVGAPLGARAMSRLPERALALVFAAVVVTAGIRLLI